MQTFPSHPLSDAGVFELQAHAGVRYFLEHEINIGEDRMFGIDPHRARHLAANTDYAVIVQAPAGEPMPEAVPTVMGVWR